MKKTILTSFALLVTTLIFAQNTNKDVLRIYVNPDKTLSMTSRVSMLPIKSSINKMSNSDENINDITKYPLLKEHLTVSGLATLNDEVIGIATETEIIENGVANSMWLVRLSKPGLSGFLVVEQHENPQKAMANKTEKEVTLPNGTKTKDVILHMTDRPTTTQHASGDLKRFEGGEFVEYDYFNPTIPNRGGIYLEFTAKKAPFSLQKQWELDRFAMPESVFAEPNSDWIYVSNYNGNNAGFISRVSKSGKIDKLHWVDGVNNPTGMAKFNGKLYVVNNNEVVRINPQTATIEKRIKAVGNVNLNDITVTPNGTFYVGNFTGGIYTFKKGDKEMKMWLNAPELATPNGIMIDENELITGTIGARMSHDLKSEELGSVYRINLKTKKIHLIKSTDKLGSFDGLIKYKNGYLASTNSDGKTHFIVGENTTEIAQPKQGKITDFGLSEDNMYAPYMFENKLVKYKIIRK